MADQRISALTELAAAPAAGDFVPIVDLDASGGQQTKKITIANLLSGGGGGAVDSVFGRTGAVVAALGDYAAIAETFTVLQTLSAGLAVTGGSIVAGTVAAAFGAVTGTTFNGVALTTGGAATNFLNETGAYSVPPGGGGAVAGSDTQIQFNNSGAFGASDGFAWDETNRRLIIDRTGGAGAAIKINKLLANAPALEVGGSGSSATSHIIWKSFDSSGGFFWQMVDDHGLSSANHKLEIQGSTTGQTPFIEFDLSGEMAFFGTQGINAMLFTGLTGTKKVKFNIPFYQEEQAAAAVDVASEGQWWVRNDTPNTPMFTDDTGVDHVLNAAGGGSQTPWAQNIDGAGFTLTDVDSVQVVGQTVAEHAFFKTRNTDLANPKAIISVGSPSGDSINSGGLIVRPDITTGNKRMTMEVTDQAVFAASSNRFGLWVDTAVARFFSSNGIGGSGPDIGITTQGVASTDYDIFIDESTRIASFAGSLRLVDNAGLFLGDSQDARILWGLTDLITRVETGNMKWQFTGTDKLTLNNTNSRLQLHDGYAFRIQNSADTDFVDMSHDNTDFNIVATNTVDINFTGLTGALKVFGPLQSIGATVAESAKLETNNGNLSFPRGVFSVGSSSGNSITNAALWLRPDITVGNVQMSMEVLDQGVTGASTNRFGLSVNTTVAKLASSKNLGNDSGVDIGITTQGITSTDYDLFIDESLRRVIFGGTTLMGDDNAAFFGDSAESRILWETAGHMIVRVESGDIKFQHAGTDVIKIDQTNDLLQVRGYKLRILDPGITDFVDFSHDGTDFNVTATNTALIKYTGMTRLQIETTGGTMLALKDNNSTGVAANASIAFLDSADAVQAQFGSSVGGALIGSATGNILLSSNSIIQFSAPSDVRITSGSEFRVYDSTNTDFGSLSHDGTDLNLVGTTTTDLNISGMNLRVVNNVGFYNTAPVAQSTGVAVTASAIHAALVTLGLITA